jgi:hypothetical protein
MSVKQRSIKAKLASLHMGKIWTTDEEAKHLAARFVGVNQAEFARKHALPGGPSMLSQHIKGRRPINMEAALVYMKGFKVGLEDISPRLAKLMHEALRQLDDTKMRLAEPPPPAYAPAPPTAEANPALTLASEFQRAPAVTADGRTRDELFDWLMAQIDAWPNVDPRKRARAVAPTAAPSPGRQKRPSKGHAPRAAGSAS